MTTVLIFFRQNSIFIISFRSSSQILRQRIKLSVFFSEKKRSPRKSSFGQNAILTTGWRFVAKVWQFHAQELKKIQKHFFFTIKCFRSKHSFGHGDAFLIIKPKNDKKTKSPLKVWIELFKGFFFRKTGISSKGHYGSVELSFDNFADSSLSNFNFFVKNLKKNCTRTLRKFTKLFIFARKNFHMEKLL